MANGRLKRPVFGVMPERGSTWGRNLPKKPFLYKNLIDIVREHEGQAAKIAEFNQGGKAKTQNEAQKAKVHIMHWLERNCPLEDWTVHVRTLPETWYHREVWVVFHGVKTAEEMAAARQQRREMMKANRDMAMQRRARAATQERMKLLAHQSPRPREARG